MVVWLGESPNIRYDRWPLKTYGVIWVYMSWTEHYYEMSPLCWSFLNNLRQSRFMYSWFTRLNFPRAWVHCSVTICWQVAVTRTALSNRHFVYSTAWPDTEHHLIIALFSYERHIRWATYIKTTNWIVLTK